VIAQISIWIVAQEIHTQRHSLIIDLSHSYVWKQSYHDDYHDDSPRCFDDAKAQRVISRLKNQAFKIPLKDSRIK